MKWLLLVFFGALVILYVGWLVFSTYLSVKASPREPMVWCPKHGPIRQAYMINFMGEYYCSICFHDRLKQAENSGGR
jgi:hypothetical protein